MINGITLTNFCMDAAGLAVSVVCLLLALILRVPERRTRSFFVTFFSVMSLYIVSNLLSLIVENFGSSALLTQLSIFFESLFSSVLMPMLLLYLLSCCGETRRDHPLLLTVLALWVGYGILLTVTQFTTAIYYISPDNVYHRGPLYPLLLVLPVLIMLVTLSGLLRRRGKLSKKQFSAFLVYLIVPTAAMLAQMFSFGLFFIVFGTAISALVMLVFIMTDQMDRYVRQQAENARQRANIMVLQMRPHFIYNTLASIYYLIDQDQTKAQQVTRDFMTYLRKNFTAIAQEDTIPFTEELEHTRAYLAVEKARFTDKLFVEFDTPHTRFRVPTLTLQPIVENAVKHGVSPDLKPLHITVSTRLTDEGSVLTVEDSGSGFVPPPRRQKRAPYRPGQPDRAPADAVRRQPHHRARSRRRHQGHRRDPPESAADRARDVIKQKSALKSLNFRADFWLEHKDLFASLPMARIEVAPARAAAPDRRSQQAHNSAIGTPGPGRSIGAGQCPASVPKNC